MVVGEFGRAMLNIVLIGAGKLGSRHLQALSQVKIKDTNTDTYLSKQAVNKIFPPNSLTGDHIIFCRLKKSKS